MTAAEVPQASALAPLAAAPAEFAANGAARPVAIKASGLTKRYPARQGEIVAVAGIDLVIPEGEFCCLVGPSGCGKTTLLRLVAGLERPSTGTIEVGHDRAGAAGQPQRPATAMVFQGHGVFPWYTVRQNVEYGLRFQRRPRAEARRTVEALIATVGLSRFADAYPHQLSEGMRQRVSIARALASGSDVLLMDEPFGNLDEQNRLWLQAELLRIWQAERKTVLFVTHSIDEALVLGDRVVVMTAHPGRIKRIIDVPFARPRNPYALKSDPAFGACFEQVWSELRDEVVRARAEEEHERAR